VAKPMRSEALPEALPAQKPDALCHAAAPVD
jgi:hypothetical protein